MSLSCVMKSNAIQSARGIVIWVPDDKSLFMIEILFSYSALIRNREKFLQFSVTLMVNEVMYGTVPRVSVRKSR